MSEFDKVCEDILALSRQRDAKKRRSLERIAEYVKALGELLYILDAKSTSLSDRFASHTVNYGDASSWSAWREFRGTYLGIGKLIDDLGVAIASSIEENNTLREFTDWLIVWIENYRFSDILRDDYGPCCIKELSTIKLNLIEVIRERRIEALRDALPNTWL